MKLLVIFSVVLFSFFLSAQTGFIRVFVDTPDPIKGDWRWSKANPNKTKELSRKLQNQALKDSVPITIVTDKETADYIWTVRRADRKGKYLYTWTVTERSTGIKSSENSDKFEMNCVKDSVKYFALIWQVNKRR